MDKVKPMTRKEIKQSALDYLKENSEYDSDSWSIAFYCKDRGVYSGVSRVKKHNTSNHFRGTVYGFVVDFVHRNFFIEGITGRIKESAGNLNDIFGRVELKKAAENSDTLNKFYILGNALGDVPVAYNNWGGSHESYNSGRGIMRAIENYPVAEQLTECKWMIRQRDIYSRGIFADIDYMSDIISDIQKAVDTSKANNIRKALGMSQAQYKFFFSINNLRDAKNYVKVPKDKLALIDQIKSVTAQVDRERGYHDADDWSAKVYRGFMERWYGFNSNWDDDIKFLMRGKDDSYLTTAVKNLVRYLYSSCYHQQAIEAEDAIQILSDYYDNVTNDNHPVKYPRYLKTAHDVAAANFRAVESEENEVGVGRNYEAHKDWEGTFGDWVVIVAQTPAEIVDEANQQSNCVAGYIQSVAKQKDTILFLRDKNDMDASVVTFEIANNTIVQAYATYDRPLDLNQSKAIREYAKAMDLKVDYPTIKPVDGIRKPVIKPLEGFHKVSEVNTEEPEKTISAKIVAA